MVNNTPGKQKKISWKKINDEELFSLFRLGPYKGGVDASNCDTKYIRTVMVKHFSWAEMKNFSPLYCAKARNYEINKALSHAIQKRDEPGK